MSIVFNQIPQDGRALVSSLILMDRGRPPGGDESFSEDYLFNLIDHDRNGILNISDLRNACRGLQNLEAHRNTPYPNLFRNMATAAEFIGSQRYIQNLTRARAAGQPIPRDEAYLWTPSAASTRNPSIPAIPGTPGDPYLTPPFYESLPLLDPAVAILHGLHLYSGGHYNGPSALRVVFHNNCEVPFDATCARLTHPYLFLQINFDSEIDFARQSVELRFYGNRREVESQQPYRRARVPISEIQRLDPALYQNLSGELRRRINSLTSVTSSSIPVEISDSRLVGALWLFMYYNEGPFARYSLPSNSGPNTGSQP